ncbi:hypothetical protein EDB83DRAFT_2319711 [Lactarius deliciosus]|nr:hypothetical protein EDB83DRAFT_2319711 [Lactarius deliciosus]
MDPVHAAVHYCKTLGPLMDEEKHDAISRYLMEGRWTDEEEEEDIPVEPAHKTRRVTEVNIANCKQMEAWECPRETMDTNYGHPDKGRPTPDNLGEDDPIVAIDTLTGEQRGKLQEVLSESSVPLTKADLWEVLMQIKSSRHRNSPETLEEETHPVVATILIRTPRPIQLPNTRADKTLLTLGDTLDDEELWDAFT